MINNDLLINIDKLHTTETGIERIRRNLLTDAEDVVSYCRDIIKNRDTVIERNGKNWYAYFQHMVITVNAYSYTIITAHQYKR